MTTKAAYEFLKPLLAQYTPEEKDDLCRMISEQNKPKPKKRKSIYDHIPTVAEYKRKLINTYFK
jgi:hypothetical protein